MANEDIALVGELGIATSSDGLLSVDDSATSGDRLRRTKFDGTSSSRLAGDGSWIPDAKKIVVAALDIDLALASHFTKTITVAVTLTVSNIPTTGNAGSFILELTDGGVDTVTWWSGLTWNAGTPPTLTASGVDILGFYTTDGGTTWRGLVLAQAVA